MNTVEQNHQESTTESKIERGITALCIPGGVYELRCVKAGKYRTVSGYFEDLEEMAAAAHNLSDGRTMPAVYVTLNPVRRDLLARSYNAVKNYAEATTADKDIPRLFRLLIDLDAIRASGISATDEEHGLALALASTIRTYLRSKGWPEPIYCDSGNGGHLIFGLDLANTPENVKLLEGVLKALDALFSDGRVKVDTTTYNPARITKLPGTMARKGDHMPGFRPHRRSCVIESPAALEPVSVELLKALVGVSSKPTATAGAFDRMAAEVLGQAEPVPDWVDDVTVAGGSWTQGRLETWLVEHGVRHKDPVEDHDGRLKYVLENCVFDPSHQGRDAAMFFTPGGEKKGMIGYKCFHDSCSGKHWGDVREKLDPKERRRPTDQGDTSWLDDLAANAKGGDGASAFEMPNVGGTGRQEPVEEPDPDKPRDKYLLDVLKAGVKVREVRTVKGSLNYLTECPCCGLDGVFYFNPQTLKNGYECTAGRKTWREGKALWGNSPSGGEVRKRKGYLIKELDALPTPRWQVKGHFPERSIVVVYGPSNVGKSFYVLDIGLCIATGTPFLGKHDVLQGAVAYVIGEGVGGVKKRVKAWLKNHEVVEPPDSFVVIPHKFDLTTMGEAEVREILEIAQEKLGREPALVILDTLSRHFGPSNENETPHMKAFCDSCDRAIEGSSATVMVVHHCGKDESKGMRGNYTLVASTDVIIHCGEHGHRAGMEIVCEKQKDAEFFEEYVITKEVIDLGGDETSLVFNLDDAPPVLDPEKKSKWKGDENIAAHFTPAGVENATSKARIVQEAHAQMKANGCQERDIPSEKRIKAAIDVNVKKGRTLTVPHPNPTQIKFYKDAGGDFGVPDVEFFGAEEG